jgi:hypothetical protein
MTLEEGDCWNQPEWKSVWLPFLHSARTFLLFDKIDFTGEECVRLLRNGATRAGRSLCDVINIILGEQGPFPHTAWSLSAILDVHLVQNAITKCHGVDRKQVRGALFVHYVHSTTKLGLQHAPLV